MPRLSGDQQVSVLTGILASLGLVLFYILVLLLLARDWQFPLKQFWVLRYWMTALVLGFGIQVGLFQYLRLQTKNGLGTKVSIGTSGSVSGFSMVACCAHHLTEVLPLLGVAGVSLFLGQYQKELLGLGILSNSVGILIMLKEVKKDR